MSGAADQPATAQTSASRHSTPAGRTRGTPTGDGSAYGPARSPRLHSAHLLPEAQLRRDQDRNQRWLAWALFLAVLLPLVTTLVASAMEAIAPGAALAIRGATVFVIPTILLCLSLRHGTLRPIGQLELFARAMLIPMVIVLPLLSVLYNQSYGLPLTAFVRFGALAVHSMSLLVLYRLILDRFQDTSEYVVTLSRLYLLLCAGLLSLAVVFYVGGKNPNFRVGYPISPGVFGFYMLLAWLVSSTLCRSVLLNVAFMASIVASGSRSSALLLAMLFLYFSVRTRRAVLIVITAAATGYLLYQFNPDIIRPFVAERDDVTAGRADIWEIALEMLDDRSVAFGYGTPQLVYVPGLESRHPEKEAEENGTHNAYIDASLSYGVLYAGCILLIWAICFYPRKPKLQTEIAVDLYKLKRGLFLAVLVKSLVTNTCWTNMADAATIFSSLILLCPDPISGRAMSGSPPAARNS